MPGRGQRGVVTGLKGLNLSAPAHLVLTESDLVVSLKPELELEYS